MFGRQKGQTDIKKSTQKLLDSKKDVPTRLKHLKLILDTVDTAEAKALFSTHYSHIYQLVYEGILAAELSFKQKGVHRAQREELENVLHMFEKVLVLLPDLLHCRWQLHSISRLMSKLTHPKNSYKLRKEGVRLFIIWYQCLGSSAPSYVHSMFSTLVPGLGSGTGWPPNIDPTRPIKQSEIAAILPYQSGERNLEEPMSYYMDCLLEYIVSQAPKIQWNEGSQMWSSSIHFLYERFKEFYVPCLFPSFKLSTDIYKPNLELPELRKSADLSSSPLLSCQVVFIKWLANYAHSVYKSLDSSNPMAGMPGCGFEDSRLHTTPPSSLSDQESLKSFSSCHAEIDANVIAKDVILGSRENINFLHEMFKRAFLMSFVQTIAIRRVICVYKDWIQINVPELPVFMLEPEKSDDQPQSLPLDPPRARMRTDSYYGAVGINANNNKEQYMSNLRAGAQNILRVFFCNSAAVFFLYQIPKHEQAIQVMEEQVDICKRVLNIYRYAVMSTRMDPTTWEQLLIVMLHIISRVLDQSQPHSGLNHPNTLGSKLAGALFQTLIVSWVKATLNVAVCLDLWDQIQHVLSQLTFSDELISEWSKTMETLTRVLSKHVYNLDLSDLPLDRLSEQKSKRKRGQSIVTKEDIKSPVIVEPATSPSRTRMRTASTVSERKSMMMANAVSSAYKKLGFRRSLSEGNLNLLSHKRHIRHHPVHALESSDYLDKQSSRGNSVSEDSTETQVVLFEKTRKKSRSMDSLRKISSALGYVSSNHGHDWTEMSSDTVSLENAPAIPIDGESTTLADCQNDPKCDARGVIEGGVIKGWLPNVAAILWRRMLGVLGNVNQFKNPSTHAHFFKVLNEIWSTLNKVRRNQGVSLDNNATPSPPDLVPPLLCFAPWCFQALELPNEFQAGKKLAVSLICEMTMNNYDLPFDVEHLQKFYYAIHKLVISNNHDLINEIIKKCGLKYFSKMIPGFFLILIDFVQAAHTVLSGEDLKKAARFEAASLLGAALTVAEVCADLPILKPNSDKFEPVQSHKSHNVVLSCLLKFSKIEPASSARTICLQSLTIYLCRELVLIRHSRTLKNFQISVEKKKKILEIFKILLSSIKIANRNVAIVSSDLLSCLSAFAQEILLAFPDVIPEIVLGICLGIRTSLPTRGGNWAPSKPIETEKRLLVSLIFTLGEWSMSLPPEYMTNKESNGNSLLSFVFETFELINGGFSGSDNSKMEDIIKLSDFDPSIPFDDLQLLEHGRKEHSSVSDSFNPKSLAQDLKTIQLASTMLYSHLMTHFNHFPMSSGYDRCESTVNENDDIPGMNAELDEFTSFVFSLPNVQMFALDNQSLLSVIELPNEESYSDSVQKELQPSPSLVRFILRDMNGKVCWDISQLHLNQLSTTGSNTVSNFFPSPKEEVLYPSAITGSFLPQTGPRINLRRRPTGILPTVENSADDLDNLEDLLSYIGHTSPECLLRPGETLTTPWEPPSSLSQESEDEVVGGVVSQRNMELEYLLKSEIDSCMKPLPASMGPDIDIHSFSDHEASLPSLTTSIKSASSICSTFISCRRFMSHFGYLGWEKRKSIDLLNKDEKLLRELKNLDSLKCRETHKIAVIYVGEGQEDKVSILSNTGGSEAYEEFVAGLGWEVELENHSGFLGGLNRNKTTGDTAPYYSNSFTEVMFHVATRMPSETDESILQKTRHLGNDEVHIVWSEHCRDYRREIIATEFCDVLIVIYPLKFDLFRIQISRKPEVPYFGPLFNECIIDKDLLSIMVRATAINASRAKRSSLQFYKHYFEERFSSLQTLMKNHRSKSVFEDFASNVYSPHSVLTLGASGASSRASGTSVSSSSKSYPADQRSSSSGNITPVGSSKYIDLPHSSNTTYKISTSDSGVHQSPVDARPSKQVGTIGEDHLVKGSPAANKRLSVKLGAMGSGLKAKLRTPPASPAASRASTNSND